MSGLARQASKISINLASAIHREAVIKKNVMQLYTVTCFIKDRQEKKV